MALTSKLRLSLALILCAYLFTACSTERGEQAATAVEPSADDPASHEEIGAPLPPAPDLAQESMSEAPNLAGLARQAWSNIGSTTYQCSNFDYFPGGGIYTFYCRLKFFLTLGELQVHLPIPVFVSGPHEDGRLDRNNLHDFGHYNPEFVKIIADYALPAAEDERFREVTQPIYDQYIGPLARTFWVTYEKLKAHPEYWVGEQRLIQESMADIGVNELHYEKYFYFMNPRFMERPDGGFNYFFDNGFDGRVYDGNVVKSLVGFWIRRGIDETAQEFADGLRRLLAIYDADFLADDSRNVESGTSFGH